MLDSVFTFSLINTLMFLLFTRKKYANHEFRVKHLKYVISNVADRCGSNEQHLEILFQELPV